MEAAPINEHEIDIEFTPKAPEIPDTEPTKCGCDEDDPLDAFCNIPQMLACMGNVSDDISRVGFKTQGPASEFKVRIGPKSDEKQDPEFIDRTLSFLPNIDNRLDGNDKMKTVAVNQLPKFLASSSDTEIPKFQFAYSPMPVCQMKGLDQKVAVGKQSDDHQANVSIKAHGAPAGFKLKERI